MSEDVEGFDKEAEKEKLRAQLERDEESRRSTQHMSELLLKGATMTNKHCDTCGDPLFRYEGQEFCPSCTQEGGHETAAVEAEGEAATTSAAGGQPEGRAGRVDQVTTAADEASPSTTTGADQGADPAVQQPPRPTEGAVPDDITGARDSLVRKLASLAARAENTDDVARSRELLAAAREAAEALAAIDRVRQ